MAAHGGQLKSARPGLHLWIFVGHLGFAESVSELAPDPRQASSTVIPLETGPRILKTL